MGHEELRGAIADTGPLLHLQEIDQLSLLSFFAVLLLYDSSLYLSRAFRKRVLELVRRLEKEQ